MESLLSFRRKLEQTQGLEQNITKQIILTNEKIEVRYEEIRELIKELNYSNKKFKRHGEKRKNN